jgi:hypothetical protein
MASGAVNTARQLGLALGVSILGLVFTAGAAGVLRDGGAPDPAGTAAALSAGQAPAILSGADPAARPALADLLSAAYTDGLSSAFLACGVAGLLGGALVLWLVRAEAPGAPRRPAPEASRDAAPAR